MTKNNYVKSTNKRFVESNSTADKEFFNIMRESNYKTKRMHEKKENIVELEDGQYGSASVFYWGHDDDVIYYNDEEYSVHATVKMRVIKEDGRIQYESSTVSNADFYDKDGNYIEDKDLQAELEKVLVDDAIDRINSKEGDIFLTVEDDAIYTDDEIIDIAVKAAKTLAYEYEDNIPEDPKITKRIQNEYTVKFGKVEPAKLYKNDVEPVNITVFIDAEDLKRKGTKSYIKFGDLSSNFSYNKKDGVQEEDYSLWSNKTKYPDYSAKDEKDVIHAAKDIIDANLYKDTISTNHISVCEPYGKNGLDDEDMEYLQKVYSALWKKDVDDVIIKDKYHSEIKLSFCTLNVNLGGRKQEYMWIVPNDSKDPCFEISANHWLLGYKHGDYVGKVSKSKVRESRVHKHCKSARKFNESYFFNEWECTGKELDSLMLESQEDFNKIDRFFNKWPLFKGAYEIIKKLSKLDVFNEEYENDFIKITISRGNEFYRMFGPGANNYGEALLCEVILGSKSKFTILKDEEDKMQYDMLFSSEIVRNKYHDINESIDVNNINKLIYGQEKMLRRAVAAAMDELRKDYKVEFHNIQIYVRYLDDEEAEEFEDLGLSGE